MKGNKIRKGETLYCLNCCKELNRHQGKYCSNQCQSEYQYKEYIDKWKTAW